MATRKKRENEELVAYKAPLLGGNRQDIIVGINGELLRIRRGVTVQIPKKYVKVLEQAAAQEEAAYNERKKAQENSAPLTRM